MRRSILAKSSMEIVRRAASRAGAAGRDGAAAARRAVAAAGRGAAARRCGPSISASICFGSMRVIRCAYGADRDVRRRGPARSAQTKSRRCRATLARLARARGQDRREADRQHAETLRAHSVQTRCSAVAPRRVLGELPRLRARRSARSILSAMRHDLAHRLAELARLVRVARPRRPRRAGADAAARAATAAAGVRALAAEVPGDETAPRGSRC